jgi:hypothetical protein
MRSTSSSAEKKRSDRSKILRRKRSSVLSVRALLSLPILAGCAAFAACATTKSVKTKDLEPTSRDYAPLVAGASYTYDVQYPGQKGSMTVKVIGEKDGYFVDDHNGKFKHTQEGLRDEQRYLIKNPLKAGSSWKAVVSASAVEHSQILSVGEKCSSPAGQFDDCLVVESTVRRDASVSLTIQWTWAKNVGLVKLEMIAEIDGKRVPQVQQALTRYALSENTAQEKNEKTEKNEVKRAPDDGSEIPWEH